MSQSASILASVLTSPPIMTNYLQASYFFASYIFGPNTFLETENLFWSILLSLLPNLQARIVTLLKERLLLIYVGYGFVAFIAYCFFLQSRQSMKRWC